MSNNESLDLQKKKELDQFKILADQMARLGLDFGSVDLTPQKEDKTRKSKKMDSTNKSIDLSNIKQNQIKEDTSRSPSISSQSQNLTENQEKKEKETEFEPIIATQLRKSRRSFSKRKHSSKASESRSASSNDNPKTTSSPALTSQNNKTNLLTTQNEPFSENQSMVDQVEIVYMRPDYDDFKLSDEEDDFSNDTTIMSTKVHHHAGKTTLYEREMKHLKYKEKILHSKRMKIIQAKEDLLQPAPQINEMPDYLNKSKMVTYEDHRPLYERAGEIHAQKLTKIALNEERKKRLKELEDTENDLNRYRKNKKKFTSEGWEKFIEKQMKWKNDVLYKKKAAELLKEDVDVNHDYQPKINEKSKKIIKKMQKNTEGPINEAYIRLYKDKEEHDERQKIREMDALPSFKPQINKNNKIKKKKIKNSSNIFNNSNTTFDPIITNYSKKNINTRSSFDYDIVSSTSKIKMKEPLNMRRTLSKRAPSQNGDFRSSIDMDEESGIPLYENQNEVMIPLSQYEQNDNEEDDTDRNYTTARYKVSLEKTKSGRLRQKRNNNNNEKFSSIEETISKSKNGDTGRSTITTCMGMPEMFVQRAKMFDELYKKTNYDNEPKNNEISTNGNNQTEADSLYKINVRNSTMGREVEDKVIASKEYSDFFHV